MRNVVVVITNVVFVASRAADMLFAQSHRRPHLYPSPPRTNKTLLAIGDSPCSGQLPDPPNQIFFSDKGYNDKLFEFLQETHGFTSLVKVRCPGESSVEFLDGSIDVPPEDGSFCYGQSQELPLSQLDAAVQAIRSQEVKVISISLGANDVLPCVSSAMDPAVCALARIDGLVFNLKIILDTLASIPPKANRPPAVVMTPYNPILALSLSNAEQEQSLAALSRLTILSLHAVVTDQVYQPYGVAVVDASEVFDGLSTTQVHDGIPQNVRNICMYAGMCNLDENGVYVLAPPQERDIHASEEGYAKLGEDHIQLNPKLHLSSLKQTAKPKPRPTPSPYGHPYSET